MINVTLDFETYFKAGGKTGYNIKSSETTMNYVRDDRFEVTGLSMKIDDQPTRWGTHETYTELLDELRELCETEEVNIIAHNTKFDGLILTERFEIFPARWSDTLAMSRGLWPHYSASLENLAIRLWPNDTEMRKGDDLKEVEGMTGEEIYANDILAQKLERYGVQDTDLTYAAYCIMKDWLPQMELDFIHITTRMFTQPDFVLNVALMEEAIEDAIKEKTEKINRGIEKIKELGLERLIDETPKKTFSSPKIFPQILTELGITVPRKVSPNNGKMTNALGKNDVPFIKIMEANPQYADIWQARMEASSNQAGTRAKRMIDAANRLNGDNKIPVPLIYYGTHTGRYGGNEKMNLQNLRNGSKHRLALTGGPGRLVFVEDSSNIEARINAWFAKEEYLLSIFRNGGDPYADMASSIYNFTVNKKDHKNERNVGKVATLGLGYGMGWQTFKNQLGSGPMGMAPMHVEPAFAMNVVKIYRRKNAKIVQNWSRADTMLEMMCDPNCDYTWGPLRVLHQTLLLPNGMTLQYPNLRASQGQYGLQFTYDTIGQGGTMISVSIYGGKLIENICQALARVVLAEQMVKVDEFLEDYDGRVNLQVHDELIATAPSGDATKVGKDEYGNDIWEDNELAEEIMLGIRKIMRTSPDWAKDLPLNSEGGYDWCYSK